MIVSSGLRRELGVKVGDFYKMKVSNQANKKTFVLRAQIVHSFKAGPGFDLLGRKAFIS
jgi:ABC-type lipoprotein release transport system permease subunit